MTLGDFAVFPALEALPKSAAALLDGIGCERLFTSRPWYDTFISAGLMPGARPLFFVLNDQFGKARALLPCRRNADGEPAVSSLTSFYSCDFRPLIATDGDPSATAFELGRRLAQYLRSEAVFGLDSLDSSNPALEPFLSGLAYPGRALLRYEHFGRWWESLGGRSYGEYLGARAGALREVIRRKGAKLERAGASFALVGIGSPQAEVEQGIADYEAVYGASWKEAEPFEQFQPTLMRKLAAAGWLRLAICRMEGRPIAAQLWVVVGSTATVLKLAHDREFDAQSPGTILTAFAIRTLLDKEGIALLDFGRGDDAYKRTWTTQRTPHIGVLSASVTRRPMLVAGHLIGAAMRKWRGVDSPASAGISYHPVDASRVLLTDAEKKLSGFAE